MVSFQNNDVMDQQERALALPPDRLGIGSSIRLHVVPDYDSLRDKLAHEMLAAYRTTLAAGRDHAVFVVPVGPTGQYERLAALCNAQRQDLSRLILINMDEYLTPDGKPLPADHRLSFRGHIVRQLWDRLDPELAPPADHHLVPDPRDPGAIARAIDRFDGVDWCFGGVGITGHVAFNDPPEPGEPDDPDAFARLPTRVVTLSRETVVVNAINAMRGNLYQIPKRAITVGMREILGARHVRLYMHRPYNAAVARLVLHGAVTATVPASLVQRHPDAALTVTAEVTAPPTP